MLNQKANITNTPDENVSFLLGLGSKPFSEGVNIIPVSKIYYKKWHNYLISSEGDVWGFYGRPVKLFQDKYGYYRYSFHIKPKTKTIRIHIIVAKLFVPNPENKIWVNHKDGDKSNNDYKNLEWVTPSENQYHAIRLKLKINKKGKLHWRSRAVAKIDPQTGEIIEIYDSINMARIANKHGGAHIVDVANHKSHFNTAGGFGWVFV